MKYLSTRGSNIEGVGFSRAMLDGLAPDGGLYIPESFPRFGRFQFSGSESIAELGTKVLKPFFEGDRLYAHVEDICKRALDFEAPLKFLNSDTAVLELFHGPTAAFKDFGARFLAECMSRESKDVRRTVLVATSGDTGGAVAGAFFGKPGFDVVILFPKGKISKRQEKQLTAWGGNIHAFAVLGDFDACQRIVKEALADQELQDRRHFISANSINIGRLLPQMLYHARASLEYESVRGRTPSLIVPTGNLGNAMAALWAKRIGFPIDKVCLATNANLALSSYFQTGEWKPRPTVATLANAMDVGNPSNAERLFHLYGVDALRENVLVESVSDDEIRKAIEMGPKKYGEIWCPHTATAVVARERLRVGDWILAATAHPAKFETIVEPLIGSAVPVPEELQALLTRESHVTEIDPQLAALKAAL